MGKTPGRRVLTGCRRRLPLRQASSHNMDRKRSADGVEIEMCLASGVETGEDLKRERLRKDEVERGARVVSQSSSISGDGGPPERIGSRRRRRRRRRGRDRRRRIEGGRGRPRRRRRRVGTPSRARPLGNEVQQIRSRRHANQAGVFGPRGTRRDRAPAGSGPARRQVSPRVERRDDRDGPGVEMMVVDGIFGSSIAFLLIRALAMFLMP